MQKKIILNNREQSKILPFGIQLYNIYKIYYSLQIKFKKIWTVLVFPTETTKNDLSKRLAISHDSVWFSKQLTRARIGLCQKRVIQLLSSMGYKSEEY